MTEDQLQSVEHWLDDADEKTTAAVVFAAVLRLGKIGRPCAFELQAMLTDADDLTEQFSEGAAWIIDAENNEVVA